MEKPRGGAVIPVLVVNQETNGGEPKQMLTGCLVNSALPSGTEKETGKRLKIKSELKKKTQPQLNQMPSLADW